MRRQKCFKLVVFSFGFTLLAAVAAGQDADNAQSTDESSDSQQTLSEVLAGHSYHGEAFNEGPRQRAYLMGGTGNVNFPVTTKSKEAQAFINQGVGQLHGFWDLEAERSFRQAAAIDPSCAMAYWGAALACLQSSERAKGFIETAVEKSKDTITDREVMYINALDRYLGDKPKEKKKRAENYIKDLESISIKYPEDLEARALVAHRIWYNKYREGLSISSFLAAESLLNEIFRVEPLHPAHHYAIHLWDYRAPERAVKSASRCGPAAPSIAHMWHMPGHIYSRLKRYEDAVYQQEASARVDHAHMMRDRVMPDEIHNFAHNNEWLIRNLVFLGRVHDAIDLAKNMIELPRHPKYNTLEKRGGSASYGRRRLMQILREYQLFDEAVELCQSSYLSDPKSQDDEIKLARLLGCSAVMTGDSAVVAKAKRSLEAIRDERQGDLDSQRHMVARINGLLDETKDLPRRPSIEIVDAESAKKEKEKANKKLASSRRRLKTVEKALFAIEGYELYAQNEFEKAVELLEKASGEDVSFLGELTFLAGKQTGGLEKIQRQVDRRRNEVIPLARLAYFQFQSGDLESAKTSFEKLRDCSTCIDLDIPMFSRMEKMAVELGFGKNWLKSPSIAADTGFRPQLESLGPMRWSPTKAPEWLLQSFDGTLFGSDDLAGQPTIVIFYLGHGCLHCAEQLQAFGPEYESFKRNGIEMIAISSDDESGLKLSLDNYDGQMPIRLISDASQTVFKQFRAYDDFEGLPLHGTFLIDADGFIRWQDISYEPFMDHEFLLTESVRLLSKQVDESNAKITTK